MAPRYEVLLVFVVVVILLNSVSIDGQGCSHSAYNKFASKTPYRSVKPREDPKPVSFPGKLMIKMR